MIQDIAPHVYDNAFAHRRAPRLGDAVLISRSGKEVLIRETEEGFRFPAVSEVGEMPLNFGFLIDDTAYFFGESGQEPEGFRYAKLAEFREKEPRYLSFAAVTGLQLIRWMETQHFCGACGTKLEPSSWERAFVCPKCGRVNYPRLNPAVIVAVLHKNKILVTTYSDRPSKGMACIAGFAEIGETIEECVHREVFEETGLKVKNLRFYKSQPWSFTDTLLFGFFCDLDGDDETVHVDPTELKEGHWMTREEMPDRSGNPSLTAEMQNIFRLGKEPK